MSERTPDDKYSYTRAFTTTDDGVALYQVYLSDLFGELVRLTYEATQPRDLLRAGLLDLALLLRADGLEPLEGSYAAESPYLFARGHDLPVPPGSPRTVRYSAFRVEAPAEGGIRSMEALQRAQRQAVGNARSFDIVFHLDRQRDVARALPSLAGLFEGS
jgi:hypothetical protein